MQAAQATERTSHLDRIGVTWAGTALATLVVALGFLSALAVAVELAPGEPVPASSRADLALLSATAAR